MVWGEELDIDGRGGADGEGRDLLELVVPVLMLAQYDSGIDGTAATLRVHKSTIRAAGTQRWAHLVVGLMAEVWF